MISERTEVLKSFDGEDIFFRCCTPKKGTPGSEKISGLIVAVHGFGEHSGRYGHVAEFVCSKGLAFASFDLRGHGSSGPRKGDAQNLHALVLDVLYVVNHSLRILGFRSRDKSFFFGILGHSFGALLVTYASSILAESSPPIFLSSPCYALKSKVTYWKQLAARMLPKLLPEVKVPLELDPSLISKNEANNLAYRNDQQILKEITSRFGQVFLDSLNETNIRSAVAQVLAPVTVVYGGADDLVNAQKTEELCGMFAATRVQSTKIAGAGHEIFNELPEFREPAFQALAQWIEQFGWAGQANASGRASVDSNQSGTPVSEAAVQSDRLAPDLGSGLGTELLPEKNNALNATGAHE